LLRAAAAAYSYEKRPAVESFAPSFSLAVRRLLFI
jgi:hypothetical protein